MHILGMCSISSFSLYSTNAPAQLMISVISLSAELTMVCEAVVVNAKMTSIKLEITHLRGELACIQGKLARMQSQLTSLKSEVTSLKAEVAFFKAKFKSKFGAFRAEVREEFQCIEGLLSKTRRGRRTLERR